MSTISGQIIDPLQRKIFSGSLVVENGRIVQIIEEPVKEKRCILPGFIDAHIHIESSMLVPSEFARIAVVHGTIATVSDPHEIGNVLGLQGIRYMQKNSKTVPFKIYFGASPCIPATSFETSGAKITPEEIRTLFEKDHLFYLSEMMNYPGVLNHDPDMMKKIAIAKELGKPIDGHSPGLKGDQAKAYIEAGISTDHECFTLEEALDKIKYGMKIIIREGSAAKNFNALHPLLSEYSHQLMFCSDDKHPDELIEGHINLIVRRSVELGYDVMDILHAASVNPVRHYGLDVGLLQIDDPADFIIVDNLQDFTIYATYINGQLVASEGRSLIPRSPVTIINHFDCSEKLETDFLLPSEGPNINVIQTLPGELITNRIILPAKIDNGHYVSDPSRDLLKLTVVNRYQNAPPSLAFINGLGLLKGAIASSVAHDSHNIIAAGTDDSSLCQVINALIETKGGVAIIQDGKIDVLPLPIAGLMSGDDGWKVAKKYKEIKKKSHILGSTLPDPFMTLSFLALLVIPSIKLSDQGLFNAQEFSFIPLSDNPR